MQLYILLHIYYFHNSRNVSAACSKFSFVSSHLSTFRGHFQNKITVIIRVWNRHQSHRSSLDGINFISSRTNAYLFPSTNLGNSKTADFAYRLKNVIRFAVSLDPPRRIRVVVAHVDKLHHTTLVIFHANNHILRDFPSRRFSFFFRKLSLDVCSPSFSFSANSNAFFTESSAISNLTDIVSIVLN